MQTAVTQVDGLPSEWLGWYPLNWWTWPPFVPLLSVGWSGRPVPFFSLPTSRSCTGIILIFLLFKSAFLRSAVTIILP
jgi:hypothetical protein